MNDSLLDLVKAVLVAVVIVIVVVVALFGTTSTISIVFEKNKCRTMTELHTDFEFKWVLWGGCMVKTPSGYWINSSEYQYLEGDVR